MSKYNSFRLFDFIVKDIKKEKDGNEEVSSLIKNTKKKDELQYIIPTLSL